LSNPSNSEPTIAPPPPTVNPFGDPTAVLLTAVPPGALVNTADYDPATVVFSLVSTPEIIARPTSTSTPQQPLALGGAQAAMRPNNALLPIVGAALVAVGLF